MYYRKDKQLDQIAHFITALANGDYEMKMNINFFKEKYITIAVLLNMLADHLKNIMPGLTATQDQVPLEHLIFHVDKELNILDYNSAGRNFFGLKNLEKLKHILDAASIKKISRILASGNFNKSLELNFITPEGLNLPMDSRISHFSNNDQLLILSAIRRVPLMDWQKVRLRENAQIPKTKFDVSKNREIIDRVHHILMNNLHRPFPSIESIAQKLETNPSFIKRGFPLIYGKTIAKYHLHKRLERALELLRDTDTAQGVIAAQCGFRSDSHFSRTFKKHYGVSPSQCR